MLIMTLYTKMTDCREYKEESIIIIKRLYAYLSPFYLDREMFKMKAMYRYALIKRIFLISRDK